MAKYSLTVTDATAEEIARLLSPLRQAVAFGDNYIHDEHGSCQPLQGDGPPAPPSVFGDVPTMRAETNGVMQVPDADDEGPENTDAPETDKRGYPWDKRIHASSKALNKDGTWRYRRNTPQETIDAVEDEIKAPAPVAPPVVETTEGPSAIPTPMVDDPLAIPPFLQRTPAPVVVVTYEQVIAELTAALNAGKMAPEALPGFYKACGVADVNGLVGNQDALNKAHERIAGL